MEELVIIGGGAAGLFCLNAFLDQGVSPLLIDKGTIGSPKMCGEHLSYDVVKKLGRWDIGSFVPIEEITLSAKGTVRKGKLTSGAMSRTDLELSLATRAKSLGGRIVENAQIDAINAKTIILATGKKSAKTFPYVGFKAHFAHAHFKPCLEMHFIKGGYFGVVPISQNLSNITCLVNKEHARSFLALHQVSLECKECPVPEFGLQADCIEPHIYPIGDAIGSLPPASGRGLNHAIDSALMAVEYYLKKDVAGYRKTAKRAFCQKYRTAAFLHTLMLREKLCEITLNCLPNLLLERLLKTLR